MKNKIIFWLSLSLSIAFMGLGICGIFIGKTITYNFKKSNLQQTIYYGVGLEGKEIIKSGDINLEFKADFNNLGAVQFLFDNSKRTDSDKLTFYIKEKGSDKWYYQNSYDTLKMANGQFYPFGFPPIQNSKGKVYEIKISSASGIVGNSVSIDKTENAYQAIYNFPLLFLKQNKNFIPLFIYQKVINYLSSLNLKDFLFLAVWSVTSVGLFFGFKSVLKKITRTKITKLKIKKLILPNCGILLLLLIYTLSHLQFLSYSQYWDAAIDYRSAADASGKLFDFVNFSKNFSVYGHSSMAYMALMSVSQNIMKNNVYLLNIENLILAVLAIWAFYKIFLYFFSDRKSEALLTTSIFAFNPLFYATSISMNFDFPVLVFGVLAFYSFLYKKYIPFVFWSLFSIFSKETGIFIYVSFIAGYFLLFDLKKLLSKRAKLNYKKYFVFLIPILIFILYLFSNDWKLWGSHGSESISNSLSFVWNNNGIFNFGINLTNIGTRIVQMFVMNFNWVLSLILIVSFIKSLIFSESIFKNLSSEKRDFMRVFVFVMLMFILFNLVYIVMPFSRYVLENTFFLILLSYVCIDYLIPRRKKIRIILLAAVAILFCIQTFKDIDPSTKILYGGRKMSQNETSFFFGMADGLVYNAQFAYLDKLSDLIIKETKGDYLVRDDENEYFLNNIPFQTNVSGIIDKIKGPKLSNIIFVHFSWFSDGGTGLDKLRKYYNVNYIKTLNVAGYTAELYSLEK